MILDENEIRSIIEQIKIEIIPVGSILVYPSEQVPHGYLPCDGREISKKTYPLLYDLIKGTWGETETTFYLPDLRGQFIRGWDNGEGVDPDSGADSMRKFGSEQDDALQGHSHNVISCSKNGNHSHMVGSKNQDRLYSNIFYSTYNYKDMQNYGSDTTNYYTNEAGTHEHTIVIGPPSNSTYQKVRISTETRPKNVALMFCIKVK